MGYVELEFLGKKYQVSEAAKEFLDYDKVLVSIIESLSSKVLEKKTKRCVFRA